MLEKLGKHVLAKKVGPGHWVGELRSLEEVGQIAEELGVAGASSLPKKINKKERVMFANKPVRNVATWQLATRNSESRGRSHEKQKITEVVKVN